MQNILASDFWHYFVRKENVEHRDSKVKVSSLSLIKFYTNLLQYSIFLFYFIIIIP